MPQLYGGSAPSAISTGVVRACRAWLQVDLSIINGEMVVRDGKLLTLDVDALIEEHNAVSQRICSHILPAK